MKTCPITLLCLACTVCLSAAGESPRAIVQEKSAAFKTYPFSDPNPVAVRGKTYPYFRFDGFTDNAEERVWNIVELENDYVVVTVMPEIGGKIWGATDKTSGKPFIYDNGVVKFRDIALRGPWTSGGIEFNYGVVGHSPTTSHPVDYLTRENEDGSASCIIRMLDLLTRTTWSVEIRLPADKAWVETNSFWHNGSGITQPYYNWTNSGVEATQDLEFVYPGTMVVRHDGTIHDWPYDKEYGKDISKWRENDFLWSKSYHIVGTHDKYFGAWWADSGLGMLHYSERDDKPGRKMFSWALSDQGDIWKELLTDDSGQYVELQSGRLFNQNMVTSVLTPYKQTGFAPYGTDVWKEYWFPYHGTGGAANANLRGVVNLKETAAGTEIAFSPLGKEDGTLYVYDKAGKEIAAIAAVCEPGKPFVTEIKAPKNEISRITLGKEELWADADKTLSRPMTAPEGFEWETAYGQWVRGQYLVWLRNYADAEPFARKSIGYDPGFVPGLNLMSAICFNRLDYQGAFDYAMRALAVDTYDGEANYLMGCAAMKLGRLYDAMDGFEIAAVTDEYRSAACTRLAKLYLKNGQYAEADEYAQKSVVRNMHNIEGYKAGYIANVFRGDEKQAAYNLGAIENLDPLNEFVRFEKYFADPTGDNLTAFRSMIRNEMAVQSYLELAVWYHSAGLDDRARTVLSLSPGDAETAYWSAYLSKDARLLEKADASDVSFVFPFREESVPVLEWAAAESGDWRSSYLLALIHYSRNNDETALELLNRQGMEPGFAPFYITRAELEPDRARRENDYKKAVELEPGQWRYAHALTKFHMQGKEDAKALAVIENFNRRHRGHFPTEILYVRALIRSNEYARAEKILAGTHILPFEGAKDGVNLQKHIKLMLAVDMMKKNRNRAAIAKIEEAKLWPRNLGVGKPYDNVIETRLEDWLSFAAAERGGLAAERERYLQQLIVSDVNAVSWHTLFQSAAMSIDGRRKEAQELAEKWSAVQKDDSARRRGEEFLETVQRGEYASDAALELCRPVIRGITGGEDSRLF